MEDSLILKVTGGYISISRQHIDTFNARLARGMQLDTAAMMAISYNEARISKAPAGSL